MGGGRGGGKRSMRFLAPHPTSPIVCLVHQRHLATRLLPPVSAVKINPRLRGARRLGAATQFLRDFCGPDAMGLALHPPAVGRVAEFMPAGHSECLSSALLKAQRAADPRLDRV